MNRDLKAIGMLLVLPILGGFAVAFLCVALDLGIDPKTIFNKANCYVAGLIVGWWMWGEHANS